VNEDLSMRRLTVWTLAVATVTVAMVACGTAATRAADKPKKSPEDRFAKLDANDDEKLSSEEFVGKKSDQKKQKAEKRFGRLDKDKDGFLSLKEFKTRKKKKKKSE
jgi:Ca2+-binding EF-hand superfamily protein